MTEPNSPSGARFLRTPAAAKLIGLSPATLRKMRVTGGGPVYCKLGRAVVYDRRELEKWATDQSRSSTSQPGR